MIMLLWSGPWIVIITTLSSKLSIILPFSAVHFIARVINEWHTCVAYALSSNDEDTLKY